MTHRRKTEKVCANVLNKAESACSHGNFIYAHNHAFYLPQHPANSFDVTFVFLPHHNAKSAHKLALQLS